MKTWFKHDSLAMFSMRREKKELSTFTLLFLFFLEGHQLADYDERSIFLIID